MYGNGCLEVIRYYVCISNKKKVNNVDLFFSVDIQKGLYSDGLFLFLIKYTYIHTYIYIYIYLFIYLFILLFLSNCYILV